MCIRDSCYDSPIDAEHFASEKCAIFLIIPEEDPTKHFMAGLMIQNPVSYTHLAGTARPGGYCGKGWRAVCRRFVFIENAWADRGCPAVGLHDSAAAFQVARADIAAPVSYTHLLNIFMPQKAFNKNGKTLYTDVFHPITSGARTALKEAVIDAYRKAAK